MCNTYYLLAICISNLIEIYIIFSDILVDYLTNNLNSVLMTTVRTQYFKRTVPYFISVFFFFYERKIQKKDIFSLCKSNFWILKFCVFAINQFFLREYLFLILVLDRATYLFDF